MKHKNILPSSQDRVYIVFQRDDFGMFQAAGKSAVRREHRLMWKPRKCSEDFYRKRRRGAEGLGKRRNRNKKEGRKEGSTVLLFHCLKLKCI